MNFPNIYLNLPTDNSIRSVQRLRLNRGIDGTIESILGERRSRIDETLDLWLKTSEKIFYSSLMEINFTLSH